MPDSLIARNQALFEIRVWAELRAKITDRRSNCGEMMTDALLCDLILATYCSTAARRRVSVFGFWVSDRDTVTEASEGDVRDCQ